MADKLPEEIFVIRENEDNPDEAFLNCSERIESFAEMGEKQRVGVYKFVETREVEGTIVVKTVD